jgi:hypothetical protein
MGEARRKKLAGLPRFRKAEPQKPAVFPPRSPQQVEQEIAERERNHARIDAAIDFIYSVEEDMTKRQIRRHLERANA